MDELRAKQCISTSPLFAFSIEFDDTTEKHVTYADYEGVVSIPVDCYRTFSGAYNCCYYQL